MDKRLKWGCHFLVKGEDGLINEGPSNCNQGPCQVSPHSDSGVIFSLLSLLCKESKSNMRNSFECGFSWTSSV